MGIGRRWLEGEFLVTHLNNVIFLDMSKLKWGDAEMIKLASALAHCHGALPRCQCLFLKENSINDHGLIALSEAISEGAMASLMKVSVDDAEHSALKAACVNRGIELR